MIGEISLYGVYVPRLLVVTLLALACNRLLSATFARFGLYRLVWHPALFDFALFVILLGGFVFLTPGLF
ncbi:DUF1656 domain-containing protein [Noviherbaspirillum massiliense]|uniref:DUF1656 domain-containing protein n=1 Tax=Noviherbaspirillum massiliense TaxID=1465823 RepID=UPI0002E87F52|nr:DUF1656 domain-containing protein [Noviherbaspirillum massiliense]